MVTAALLFALVGQDPADPFKQTNALWKEYSDAREAFERSLRGVADADERRRLADEERPALKYLPRFRELAARLSGPAAESAHFFVFNLALELGDGKAAGESAWAALKANPSSQHVREMARELQQAHYLGWKWAREWLRAVIERTTARDAKATAMYSFAYTVSGASGTTPEERAEAATVLRALEKDFAETPQTKQARRLLFEIENLAIGCVAPDFDAKDVDGVAFQLSDYRGKVVVLDFWGFW